MLVQFVLLQFGTNWTKIVVMGGDILEGGFDKFIEKLKRFELKHTKVHNEEMFDWFNQQGLEMLKDYCGKGTKLEYNISESGIDVTIITKEILLLTDFDSNILNLLHLASTCKVVVIENQKMKISLWFKGWKWLEKDCFSGATEVE